MKKLCLVLVLLHLLIEITDGVMLRRECPQDETHRSCSFYEEYTCWQNSERVERVRSLPKRMAHCKAGCFCKKGLVRAYPGGRCITAVYCQDKKLQNFMAKLPKDFSGF